MLDCKSVVSPSPLPASSRPVLWTCHGYLAVLGGPSAEREGSSPTHGMTLPQDSTIAVIE